MPAAGSAWYLSPPQTPPRSIRTWRVGTAHPACVVWRKPEADSDVSIYKRGPGGSREPPGAPYLFQAFPVARFWEIGTA